MAAGEPGGRTSGSGTAGSVTREIYSRPAALSAWGDPGRQARPRPATYIPIVRPSRPPFALDVPGFPFPSLAKLAGRAPLGGPREIALAAFVCARLSDPDINRALSVDGRRARAAGAKRWLGTLAIAEPMKSAFSELIASVDGGSGTTAAVRRVIEVTGSILDAGSRAELDLLVRRLETQPIAAT